MLNKVNSSNDIKRLNKNELPQLCAELREFIIENVSKTGGHLASNLGTVELTVALHRVYDSAVDRIVFDVGHQSYAHKIITGRRDAFGTLRCYGGLSGFPKPYEADDDAFIAGHASNSVSVALGMARARTIKGENYSVCAVIGDGALTGGLAYEGLANVGGSSEPIVIILNDNGMSINGNVGGMAKLLSKERVKPGYINFKRWYRQAVSGMDGIYNASHKLKEALKKSILPSNMFDSMGIYYLGPVDGHDVDQLETVIRWAKEMNTPVLVHVISKKGKGCAYAEEHPDKYHGVGRFDPVTGKMPEAKPCFSSVFGNKLTQLAETNHNIVAITAAMCAGTGLTGFSERFPDRFFDVGIAEEHAVSMAAGMAKQGLLPVVAIYSGFLQRAYDMLIHDVSLQDLHVVFCVDRAGLVGNDGETHHGAFDISYLRSVPHMQVLCPANFAELEAMLDEAVNRMSGPVAIRYPRGGGGRYTDCHTEGCTHLRSGNDITIAAYGTDINIALNTADILADKGIHADVYKLSRLNSGYYADIIDSMRETGRFLMSEQVCQTGCIADEILAYAERAGVKIECAYTPNLGSGIVVQGTVPELIRHCGLDENSLAKAAEKLVRGE
ncbi:MAG: 1-deoxy-D-xylulose-5-phosphate synthase [Firmicutes bacterium]|nr:1-deoxy-D-xylulose-5-phosphate synthase [Bacillota bacterium]